MRYGKALKDRLNTVRKEMIEKGYKGPTFDEALIYLIKGEEFLKTVLDTAFRYGYWEAKELEIDEHGENYQLIQKVNMVVLTSSIADLIAAHPYEEVAWKPATDHEMILFIKNKYATPLEDRLARGLNESVSV